MSAPTNNQVGPGTLITVKVAFEDSTRRFKIPLRDLGARTLPQNVGLHSSSARGFPASILFTVPSILHCRVFLLLVTLSMASDLVSFPTLIKQTSRSGQLTAHY